MPLTRITGLHDIDHFFSDVFEKNFKGQWCDLALDLYQENNQLVAEMAIAGLDPEHTHVSVVDDILRISGSREEKEEKKGKNFYSKEIRRGSFERSIRLPAQVSAQDTKASYKKGILKVFMPLKKSSEEKRIPVKSED